MLKLTPVKDSPDQFTMTADNLDIQLIAALIKRSVSIEDLEACDCKRCKHATHVLNSFIDADKFIDENQRENVQAKMLKNMGMTEADVIKKTNQGIKIIDLSDPNGPSLKDLLDKLLNMK